MTSPQPFVHAFTAAKGGQGTTVVAAATALLHARQQRRTLLLDASGKPDCRAALGVPEPSGADEPATINPFLDLIRLEPGAELSDMVSRYEVVVIDSGQEPTAGADQTTLVTRSCYLALRRAIAVACTIDDVVLVEEPGRALHAADVAAVLGRPIVATVPVRPEVARCVDAGLLACRLPRVFDALGEAVPH